MIFKEDTINVVFLARWATGYVAAHNGVAPITLLRFKKWQQIILFLF
jgi:hypothetical protein